MGLLKLFKHAPEDAIKLVKKIDTDDKKISNLLKNYLNKYKQMNNIIPYGRQKIFKSDFVEINKALKSNFITNGEYVKKVGELFHATPKQNLPSHVRVGRQQLI